MYNLKLVKRFQFIGRGKVTVVAIILLFWICIFLSKNNSETKVDREHGRWKKRESLLDVCGEFSETKPKTHAATGCILESNHRPNRLPTAVDDPHACNFLNEDFYPAFCAVELDMWSLVNEVISPTDVVMEFGGRYGTTTCAIAVKQNNSGALISVEADPDVWVIAEFNKLTHNCACWSVLGVVGDEDQVVQSDKSQFGGATLGYFGYQLGHLQNYLPVVPV